MLGSFWSHWLMPKDSVKLPVLSLPCPWITHQTRILVEQLETQPCQHTWHESLALSDHTVYRSLSLCRRMLTNLCLLAPCTVWLRSCLAHVPEIVFPDTKLRTKYLMTARLASLPHVNGDA